MSFETIEVKSLVPSENNYRRSFDAGALEELTASIKAKGVLQPILVRPLNGWHKGKYEIVAGHRRFHAAREAGLKDMPAMVKALSDEEALEVQVIENSQREDPNPIDEAYGFKKLLEMGRYTPETLAEKIDHSVAYVLGRVRLAELDKTVQDKVASGELSFGHALLFTRLRRAADQKKFLKEIADEDLSVAEAKRRLGDYTLNLSNAAFDTAKCETCQSRSRNQAVLFPDLSKTDECADMECFQTKIKAHWLGLLKTKQTEGFKTYTDEKTIEKLTAYGAKSSARICANKKDANEHGSGPFLPPKYKTDCVACTGNHAFYLTERKHYNHGKVFVFGEICLDRKCLDRMRKQKTKDADDEASSSGKSRQDDELEKMRRAERAAKCRDRFLLRELASRIEASVEAQKRLILWLALEKYYKCENDVGEHLDIRGVPVKRSEHDNRVSYEDVPGPFSMAFPNEHLNGAITAALLRILEVVPGEELLVLAPAAGLDVKGNFSIDREYLESQSFKNKGDIIRLAKELGVEVDEKKPKAALVEQILGQELKGKVSKEIAEALEPEDCVCERPSMEESNEHAAVKKAKGRQR
ncbi:MAG: ParB/RepB/Spo0J family partition protein [Deltaproteobacteria bacterium]